MFESFIAPSSVPVALKATFPVSCCGMQTATATGRVVLVVGELVDVDERDGDEHEAQKMSTPRNATRRKGLGNLSVIRYPDSTRSKVCARGLSGSRELDEHVPVLLAWNRRGPARP